VLHRGNSRRGQFAIAFDDSIESIMASLKICKDRTLAALHKLAWSTGSPRLMRRILAITNALDGITGDCARRACRIGPLPSRPARLG